MIDSLAILETCAQPSRLDSFDSRGRVICAIAAAAAVAAVKNALGLAAGSFLPVLLLIFDWRGRFAFLASALASVNKIGVFIWIFLPLTYPGETLWGPVTREGLMAALSVTWKLNLISVIFLQMAVSMGIPEICGALGRMRFPKKLRLLLMLTMRYVLMLSGRMTVMNRALSMRSGGDGGLWPRVFACMMATTLIHGADRAERSSLAMSLRGGEEGFAQFRETAWAARDSIMCAAFALNAVFVLLCGRVI